MEIYTYIYDSWLFVTKKYESFSEKSGGNFGKKGLQSIDRRARSWAHLGGKGNIQRPDEKWWWRKMDISAAFFSIDRDVFPYNHELIRFWTTWNRWKMLKL